MVPSTHERIWREVLAAEDRVRIHALVLRILQQAGVQADDEQVLAKGGA